MNLKLNRNLKACSFVVDEGKLVPALQHCYNAYLGNYRLHENVGGSLCVT